jgi:serine protease
MQKRFTLPQIPQVGLCILFLILCMGGRMSYGQGQVDLLPSSEPVPYTLVFKLKPEFRGNVKANTVQSEPFNRALKAVSARNLIRKYPQLFPSAAVLRTKSNAIDLSLIFEMEYDTRLSFEKAKKQLEASGMVEYVEPLYFRDVLGYPNDPMADSLNGSQYYLKKINAYKAWTVSKGDTNIVVGIVDTGIRLTHQDLGGKIKYNYADPIDGIDNDGDGYVDNFRGWDTADNDNDPTADNQNWGSNGHGISVAGVVGGQTNNKKGIASVGFNTQFLPIKAYSSRSGGRFGGYEGIIYAADRGCKVINLSWGGAGTPSAYEQDIINYAAINKDVVIVAAAGNTNAELNFYPASYDNVLSVGMTDQNDIKARNATFSYKIDLMAPGMSIQTTSHASDSAYGSATGSSFAAPMVAASAALVRSKFPHYNALQVAEQIRVTTDNIYHLAGNQAFKEMLGSGRLNLFRALTDTNTKSVRNNSVRVNDEKLTYPGNTFTVLAEFTNYLKPTGSLALSLTSSSPYVTIQRSNFSAGSVQTLGKFNNHAQPFLVKVAENIPVNEKVSFRIGFEDGTYTDYQYFQVTLNKDILTVDVNQLAVSINSKGNFGYDGHNFNRGIGFSYKNSRSLLSEGGLMIGTSTTKVSDNLRNDQFKADADFFSLENLKPAALSSVDEFSATGSMRDSVSSKNVGVVVTHKAFAWNNQSESKFVILEYTIKNVGPDTLKNLHAGLFADWDIMNPFKNLADWDAENQMGYVYNVENPSVFAGIKLLSGTAHYYAIESSGGSASAITLINGFSTEEKFKSMSSGTTSKKAGLNGQGNDVAHVVSAALAKLAPGASVKVAFALLAGDNLEDLKTTAKTSQARYNSMSSDQVLSSAKPKEQPEANIRVFPNPTAGQLTIDIHPSFLTGGEASVEIFNLIGDRLQHQTIRQAAAIPVDLQGYANGVYLVRLTNSKGVITRKVQVRK